MMSTKYKDLLCTMHLFVGLALNSFLFSYVSVWFYTQCFISLFFRATRVAKLFCLFSHWLYHKVKFRHLSPEVYFKEVWIWYCPDLVLPFCLISESVNLNCAVVDLKERHISMSSNVTYDSSLSMFLFFECLITLHVNLSCWVIDFTSFNSSGFMCFQRLV